MKIQYIIVMLIFFSCNLIDKQPKCSDEEVKKKVLEIFKEKIKPELIDSYVKEKINYSDLSDYASTNGYSYNNVVEKEETKLKNEAEIYAIKVFNDVILEEILTSKIDKDIKKCNCEANFKSQYLKEIGAYYSAQYNDEGKTHVELLYKIK